MPAATPPALVLAIAVRRCDWRSEETQRINEQMSAHDGHGAGCAICTESDDCPFCEGEPCAEWRRLFIAWTDSSSRDTQMYLAAYRAAQAAR